MILIGWGISIKSTCINILRDREFCAFILIADRNDNKSLFHSFQYLIGGGLAMLIYLIGVVQGFQFSGSFLISDLSTATTPALCLIVAGLLTTADRIYRWISAFNQKFIRYRNPHTLPALASLYLRKILLLISIYTLPITYNFSSYNLQP